MDSRLLLTTLAALSLLCLAAVSWHSHAYFYMADARTAAKEDTSAFDDFTVRGLHDQHIHRHLEALVATAIDRGNILPKARWAQKREKHGWMRDYRDFHTSVYDAAMMVFPVPHAAPVSPHHQSIRYNAAALPWPILEAASATDGKFVFLAGGFNISRRIGLTAYETSLAKLGTYRVAVYNIETGASTTLPSIPYHLSHAAGAWDPKRRWFHVVGGLCEPPARAPIEHKGSLRSYAVHFALEIDKDGRTPSAEWMQLADMPEGRAGAGCVFVESGRLLCLGGTSSGDLLGDRARFDKAIIFEHGFSDSHEPLIMSDMELLVQGLGLPRPRRLNGTKGEAGGWRYGAVAPHAMGDHVSVACIGERVYVFGGRDCRLSDVSANGWLQEYNVVSNTWRVIFKSTASRYSTIGLLLWVSQDFLSVMREAQPKHKGDKSSVPASAINATPTSLHLQPLWVLMGGERALPVEFGSGGIVTAGVEAVSLATSESWCLREMPMPWFGGIATFVPPNRVTIVSGSAEFGLTATRTVFSMDLQDMLAHASICSWKSHRVF
jgi:hypothetical protein